MMAPGLPKMLISSKHGSPAYEHTSIRDIVREMMSYADAMTMSSKKDAIVNMGGFIGFRDEELFQQASVFNILFEGYITYGGMSGRDMNALAQGLYEGTEFDYLETRVGQVAYLGQKLSGIWHPGAAAFWRPCHFRGCPAVSAQSAQGSNSRPRPWLWSFISKAA